MQAELSTAVSLLPLPAAWLPRMLWIGPTWEVGGTLATPLLVTEEDVRGLGTLSLISPYGVMERSMKR